MNKLIIFIGFLILISLFLFILNYRQDNLKEEIKKICFEKNCFNLEITDNDLERAKGLMFRRDLCNDCGMLFVFEKEGIYKV